MLRYGKIGPSITFAPPSPRSPCSTPALCGKRRGETQGRGRGLRLAMVFFLAVAQLRTDFFFLFKHKHAHQAYS